MTVFAGMEKMFQGPVVIIYHDKCSDGLTAAAAATLGLKRCMPGKAVEYIGGDYEKNLPEDLFLESNRLILIVDLSYPEDVLIRLASKNRVLVFDHHKTAIEKLSHLTPFDSNPLDPLNLDSGLILYLDETRAGCEIVSDFFGLPLSYLVRYVADRDTWKFRFGDKTRAFAKYLDTVDHEGVGDFLGLMKRSMPLGDWNPFETELSAGQLLLQNYQRQLKALEKLAGEITISLPTGPVTGLSVNCPGEFASDLGHILAVRSKTFGATWFQRGDTSVKFSLRSTGDYDVAKIAEYFGGGGHKNAAGFVLAPHSRSGDIQLWSESASKKAFSPKL